MSLAKVFTEVMYVFIFATVISNLQLGSMQYFPAVNNRFLAE